MSKAFIALIMSSEQKAEGRRRTQKAEGSCVFRLPPFSEALQVAALGNWQLATHKTRNLLGLTPIQCSFAAPKFYKRNRHTEHGTSHLVE